MSKIRIIVDTIVREIDGKLAPAGSVVSELQPSIEDIITKTLNRLLVCVTVRCPAITYDRETDETSNEIIIAIESNIAISQARGLDIFAIAESIFNTFQSYRIKELGSKTDYYNLSAISLTPSLKGTNTLIIIKLKQKN